MNYIDATLGDLLSLKRGYDLPDSKRKEGQIPIVGSAGITGYHNEAKVFGGGVTVGRSGNSFGKVFRCKEDFWAHNACLYVNDFKGNNKDYIFYFLSNLNFENYNSGSAQPSLNRNFIYPIKIKIPPLPTQQKIASILSAYDDLIENNLKRIKLLEEAAQNIYKEWFVNMRFPNYENTPINEETGLPEGWDKTPIYEVAKSHNRQRIPLNSKERDERQKIYPYYGATGIMDYVDEYLFDGKYLLVAEDGSVQDDNGHPILQFVKEKFWVNNHAHILSGENVRTELLYLTLSNETISHLITGAVQPKLSMKNFSKVKITLAPKDIMNDFSDIINPIFNLIFNLKNHIDKLKEARDILLPRLMNRTIEV